MMEDITMQGKKLGKHMDVRDMRQYPETDPGIYERDRKPFA